MSAQLALQLDAISEVLASWGKMRTESGVRSAQGRLGPVLDTYPIAEPRALRGVLRQAPQRAVRLERDAGGYVRGPVVDDRAPVLWPVATAWARMNDDGALEVQLRLAVFFEHAGDVHVSGWRFETAETTGKPHPYLHAQQIAGFAGADARTFLPTSAQREDHRVRQAEVNQMRPCFPLRGSSAAGLAIAMLATLHGASRTRDIVDLCNRSVKNTCRDQVQDVLG